MQEFRRGRHRVSLLTVHLVCVTKYRRRIFDGAALNWLAGHFRKVCEAMDWRLIASDGEADHVHMLVEYPPYLTNQKSRSIAIGNRLIEGDPQISI